MLAKLSRDGHIVDIDELTQKFYNKYLKYKKTYPAEEIKLLDVKTNEIPSITLYNLKLDGVPCVDIWGKVIGVTSQSVYENHPELLTQFYIN